MSRMPTTRKAKAKQLATDGAGATSLYIRVSTDKQATEGFSLDAQREKLNAYCVSQGWTVDEKHVYVDSGVSAKSTERPEYQRMLAAVADGQVQRIVAIKLDRISRNTKDFLGLLDYCDDHGCGIVSIAENFDTSTAVGRAVVTVLMALAELERKQIGERMQMGRTEKARQGERNGAPTPYGYVRNEAGKWSAPWEQAAVVREIFRQFNNGASLRSIAAALNDADVPTPGGKAWYARQVSYILDNGLYAGVLQYLGKEVKPTEDVPAIVSREAYDQAGARLAQLRPGNPNFGKAAE